VLRTKGPRQRAFLVARAGLEPAVSLDFSSALVGELGAEGGGVRDAEDVLQELK
jgi:hypothetical protein